MPFDSPAPPTQAPPPVLRPAILVLLLAAALTFAAVRWHVPFAGTAALLTVFGGGLWLGLRLVRRFPGG